MTGSRSSIPSLRVVLDANVLLKAPIRDTLLRAAEEGFYLPHWNSTILAEVARNLPHLIERRPDASRRAAYLIQRLTMAFPDALVEEQADLLPRLANHPGDRHVLAAAIHIGASLILTYNLRHFPRAALAPHGIVAVTPDTLLSQLFARDPAILLEVLREQGADLNPPRTVEAVLATLDTDAPRFVALVRRARDEL
jgi:predicted nucleic acid-binding protein